MRHQELIAISNTNWVLLSAMCLLLVLFNASQAASQQPAFAYAIGGVEDDTALDNSVDSQGNSYVTGIFEGTVDFDPGPGVYNLVSTSFRDFFLLKLDAGGELVWATNIGPVASTGSRSTVAVDNSGGVCIAGSFGLSRYNSLGSFLWNIDTASPPSSVEVDSLNNCYIVGGFGLAKYNSTGTLAWAFSAPGLFKDIAVDDSGNSHVTGDFQGTIDLDPGPETYTLSANCDRDLFAAKYDSAGSLVSAFNIGGLDARVSVTAIHVDAASQVFVTGLFWGTVDFDPGLGEYGITSNEAGNLLLAKYDDTGFLFWALSIFDPLSNDSPWGLSISTDYAGNAYLTGILDENGDFDPGPGVFELTTAGDEDLFLAKYNALGQFVWAFQVGDTGEDLGEAVATDEFGAIYIAGQIKGTVDADPGPGVLSLSTAGAVDIFVAKYTHQSDSDGDGVLDDVDDCPESDLSFPTITIDGCDTGVEDTLFETGCSISDLIGECAAQAWNHGGFVSCVAQFTNQLKSNGIITGREKGKIQRCAARADLP